MRIVVNYDQCSAHGKCVKRAPEVFRLADDDTLTVLDAAPPETSRKRIEAAAEWCPKAAITIEEDD